MNILSCLNQPSMFPNLRKNCGNKEHAIPKTERDSLKGHVGKIDGIFSAYTYAGTDSYQILMRILLGRLRAKRELLAWRLRSVEVGERPHYAGCFLFDIMSSHIEALNAYIDKLLAVIRG